MKDKKQQHLTSVKIDQPIWDNFQIEGSKLKITFQKLSERAAYLFNTDSEFRSLILNTKIKDNNL